MKSGRKRAAAQPPQRIELGQYIVVDPEICHGKPTFKGTRIMVWQVLDALERGESTDKIVANWGGKVSKPAIAETVRLARQALLDTLEVMADPEAMKAIREYNAGKLTMKDAACLED